MEKISIIKILKNTFLLPWNNRLLYSKTLVIPIMLLISVLIIWMVVSTNNTGLNFLFYFLDVLASGYLTIVIHKLVLAENKGTKSIIFLKSGIFSRFIVTMVIVTVIAIITVWSTVSILINFVDFEPNSHLFPVLFMYIFARFCLVFPAIALGFKPRLIWSWRETKENQFRIFFIVAIFPWIMSLILEQFYWINTTIIVYVITNMLSYICVALGIIAISLTYKELYHIQSQKE